MATMITIIVDNDDGDDDDVNEENDDYDNFDRNGWWFIPFMQVPEGELYQLQLGQKLWRGDLKAFEIDTFSNIFNLRFWARFASKYTSQLETGNWHIFQNFQSQVLSQICSTLFDYPAIRECEELVRKPWTPWINLNSTLEMFKLCNRPLKCSS